jgi:protoporphyrinogen oxidase
MSDSTIILGGGIAGILSALILAKQGIKVTIIEKEPMLGGLLNSAYHYNDYAFDYGTHFLTTTGISALDNLLFNKDFVEKCYQYPFIKAGNVFAGQLNSKSPSLNMHALNNDSYNKICGQLFNLSPPSDMVPANCKTQLDEAFGPYISDTVFSPILKKLVGETLENLAPDAHRLFSLQRIIVGNEYITQQLKTLNKFNECISYQDYATKASSYSVYYPQTGMTQWITSLAEQLNALGVNILLKQQTQHLTYDNGWHCTLSSGRVITSSRLVSTISPFILAKIAKLKLPVANTIKFRNIHLLHIVISGDFKSDLHYFYNYDLESLAFRVTLYPKISQSNNCHCTIEIINQNTCYEPFNVEKIVKNLKQELVDLDIICATQDFIHSKYQYLGPSFPVRDTGFVDACETLDATIMNQFPTLESVGKAQGKEFFMIDVLKNVYQQLTNSKE